MCLIPMQTAGFRSVQKITLVKKIDSLFITLISISKAEAGFISVFAFFGLEYNKNQSQENSDS